MASTIIVLNSSGVALTEIDYGTVEPGEVKSMALKYLNQSASDAAALTHKKFGGLQGDSFTNDINVDGDSFQSVRVIRETSQGVMQVSTIAKESADAELIPFEQRIQCFEYVGGVYVERNTGAVNFMADPADRVYLFCDERILNINVIIDTPGEYTGFAVKISQTSGNFVAPVGLVDGTAGMTINGIIQIDLTSAEDWRKIKINGKWSYAVEFSCTGVVTQAITTENGLYWQFAYDLPKHFIAGTGTYWLKSDEATPTYSEIFPDYEYQNIGRIVFLNDPILPDNAMVCEITYKNPQSKTYQIDVDSVNTVTVTEDGGSPSSSINVSTILGNKNLGIILGCEIVLKTGTLTVGNRATVKISPMLKYLWSCLTDTYNDYVNGDLELGALVAGDDVDVYTKYIPALNASESENERFFEDYVTGS